jgi:hypothetical protein
MIRSFSFRRRSAVASRRASGEPADAFALADRAPLVDLALRVPPSPEAVARLFDGEDPAVDRLARPRPVVFAPDVDFVPDVAFDLLLLACGTFPP